MVDEYINLSNQVIIHFVTLLIEDIDIEKNDRQAGHSGALALPCRMATGLISAASNAVREKSVKKGRLFERSEFLPFSFATKLSSEGNAALNLSFWYLFLSFQYERKRYQKESR